MVRRRGRKPLFTILIVVGVLIVILVLFFLAKALLSTPSTPTAETSTKDTPSVSEEAQNTEKPVKEDVPKDTTEQAAINMEDVATVAIDPMTITVSYMKGIGGFDYQVLRTSGGTKYVQFSSEKLAGTKCTNDMGVFASIIESPTADETATVTKTTTVDTTRYGLSLADATCTSDSALLKQYQDAFSEPFSLLKKM